MEKTITYKDLKFLYSILDSNEEVDEVVNYLKEHGLSIQMKEGAPEPSLGMAKATHYYLEGVDLSGNGFCFGRTSLLRHVRNYRKSKEIEKSLDYKMFLKMRDKYEEVYRYLNQ